MFWEKDYVNTQLIEDCITANVHSGTEERLQGTLSVVIPHIL